MTKRCTCRSVILRCRGPDNARRAHGMVYHVVSVDGLLSLLSSDPSQPTILIWANGPPSLPPNNVWDLMFYGDGLQAGGG